MDNGLAMAGENAQPVKQEVAKSLTIFDTASSWMWPAAWVGAWFLVGAYAPGVVTILHNSLATTPCLSPN